MLSLKYNFLFELFSKETQGSELSPPTQNQLKYETRTWRVALIPEIVAAVLKVNEHQLLFVRSLATLQQQDVSCKTSKHSFLNDHGMKKNNKISAYRGQLFRFRFKLLRLTLLIFTMLLYFIFVITFLTVVVAEDDRGRCSLQQGPDQIYKD